MEKLTNQKHCTGLKTGFIFFKQNLFFSSNLGVKYDMEVSPSDSLIKQQSVSELVCEDLV